MKIRAVAARRWRVSTWLACGAWPVTAPPLLTSTFRPEILEGADLLYICLHGLDEQPFWYADDWSTAITAEQIGQCDLTGSIVYLAGCFGQGPMTKALLDAGARSVVGSGREVWGGYFLPTGTNARGRAFVRSIKAGQTVNDALHEVRRVGGDDETLAAYGDIFATI